MEAWYAVHTQARMEKWARSNLWEQGFEVYLPVYRKQRRHARKVDWISAPLFPRYLFVRADLQRSGRRLITSAHGVDHLVSFGNDTPKIDDRVIAEIQAREDENGNVRLCDAEQLKTGDPVRMHSGALVDKTGLFVQVSDAERVVVLLELLGRQVRVKVPTASLVRAG